MNANTRWEQSKRTQLKILFNALSSSYVDQGSKGIIPFLSHGECVWRINYLSYCLIDFLWLPDGFLTFYYFLFQGALQDYEFLAYTIFGCINTHGFLHYFCQWMWLPVKNQYIVLHDVVSTFRVVIYYSGIPPLTVDIYIWWTLFCNSYLIVRYSIYHGISLFCCRIGNFFPLLL